ncbi:DUF4249 family protein [Agriterribacter sp.]|uniref:DUF4249 family protein n=1 Tax=Agriterribacter sp. TaxID=2821509 RepID=UPI002C8D6A3E|nr:DUF4249 family protein [Agriterribacter sp.]HRO47833.1 DUF4249 family protein [Agriterribacter sp.]HRQ15860.1 DUF4249 family protein [Agriterribacter sp.]
MTDSYKLPNIAIIISLLLLFTGCEKNFDIGLGHTEPQLVVEAYINTEIPAYNYVILSKSQTIENTSIASIPVKNALVKISEGSLMQNNTIVWDSSSSVILKETTLPDVPAGISDGIYTDPNLQTDPARALRGIAGKYYLLEIEVNGEIFTATAPLLSPIPIDHLSTDYHYTDEDGTSKGRITVNFKDPDTTGNCQLFYWRHSDNQKSFGWGSLGTRKRITNSDENNNGSYMRLTNSYGFVKGDSITYYMANVTRDVYNFWDSYNKARNSNGPLSTPVSLLSNISGNNVTGCFSGLAISAATIIMD